MGSLGGQQRERQEEGPGWAWGFLPFRGHMKEAARWAEGKPGKLSCRESSGRKCCREWVVLRDDKGQGVSGIWQHGGHRRP